ncbi:2-amino-3,7-dideoxy-D-threo-hept-6-ulosonate synthase [Micromonospora sp. NPDC093277]|uniref:2-amino-3,7-dideoxy-D-threo-hept-6-ulosonate synthase n=1 Tax=Micromonospora sp. NPDC093277 TaxID=3364291 RepID=UPI00380D2726
MHINSSFARQVRLRRLHRHADDRLFVVPLDHSVTDGPVTGGQRVDRLIGQLAENGVDAVVLHKGVLRYVDPRWFADLALVVHLSASTVNAPDPDAKYLVATVAEALSLGADAVSVHVNVGSREESRQIADLAAVAEACERWNVPLLAMMYPRGPKITDPGRADLVAHSVILAADLGADLVKTVYPGSVEALRTVTGDSPVPVIVAGGPRRGQDDLAAYVDDVVRGGAAGVAMGRNVFEAEDPGAVAAALAARIHPILGRPALRELRFAVP